MNARYPGPSIMGTMTCNCWQSCAYYILLLFIIFLAWKYQGEIVNEIHLLNECHFNVTSQAQKILSLTSELRQTREESNKLNQERKECLNDKDLDLSTADSHYWNGFRHAALSVIAICILFTCIFIGIFYNLVCRCLERFRFQYREEVVQQHQRWQQAIQ